MRSEANCHNFFSCLHIFLACFKQIWHTQKLSDRGVAQLVEQRPPKPWAEGSNPSTPVANKKSTSQKALRIEVLFLYGFRPHEIRNPRFLPSPPRNPWCTQSRYFFILPQPPVPLPQGRGGMICCPDDPGLRP